MVLSRDLEQTRTALTDWVTARNPGVRDVRVTELSCPRSGFSGELLLGDAQWSDGGETVTRRLVIRVEPAAEQVFLDARFEEQYRVQEILSTTTDIPVPRTIAFEADPSFLGARFYVTERVDGRSVDLSSGEHWWMELPAEDRRLVCSGCVDQMAAIHRLDWAALGLDFLDEPRRGATHLMQQLHYYREFYDWSAADFVRAPVLERTLDWLDEHRPAEEHPPVLLWGDARHGNILYDHHGGVAGVIDWEISTLGPPEIDVGWCLGLDRMSRRHPAIAALPSMDSTLPYYERLLGRPVEHLEYHVRFSLARAAIIQHRHEPPGPAAARAGGPPRGRAPPPIRPRRPPR